LEGNHLVVVNHLMHHKEFRNFFGAFWRFLALLVAFQLRAQHQKSRAVLAGAVLVASRKKHEKQEKQA
jgi:hypothetical protein